MTVNSDRQLRPSNQGTVKHQKIGFRRSLGGYGKEQVARQAELIRWLGRWKVAKKEGRLAAILAETMRKYRAEE